MSPAIAKTTPHVGDCWEVEGETFAEFAPNIRATRARLLGPGTLPDVVHPNWGQLVDGSLDTQYIEVEGIVAAAQGNTVTLLARGGHVNVQLPEFASEDLPQYEGALVRIRGCLIPGRDPVTQQVKLGEFALRSASIVIDEAAPKDLFALPLKRATDLLLFDSHVSPIQRIKLQGVLLGSREGTYFFMDGSNGVRALPKSSRNGRPGGAMGLRPGDLAEIVGFPDLNGPSPVLRDAVVRGAGAAGLPQPAQLAPDRLLDDRLDSTLVEIEGTLLSRQTGEEDQILEMRSGGRIWSARLPLPAGKLRDFLPGSELRLTGVYLGRGGDRASGRMIDSFELLLTSPAGVSVLRQPSWWTARHALAVAGALSAVLLLALFWIRALHRQVEARTAELKLEVAAHERTEAQLQDKTKRLTREMEERERIQAEVERGHKQLMITSRLAGMAEVATSVLHNVGNAMTNVNVLSGTLGERIQNSKISGVLRLGELLRTHQEDLPRFVQADEQGRNLVNYVGHLGTHLTEEQATLLEDIKVLRENLDHINEIVAMQQDYAGVSGVLETLPADEVAEHALRMHGESMKRHGITVARDYAPGPAVLMDRHKVLQILFNLLENAKHACCHSSGPDKKITVGISFAPNSVRVSVSDTGVGISPENLTQIFRQGFSTRKDGHGFGLHSSILTAQGMGGGLTAQSEGLGKGATFTLEIPIAPAPAGDARRVGESAETDH
jgi:signal transduction histidine kinase